MKIKHFTWIVAVCTGLNSVSSKACYDQSEECEEYVREYDPYCMENWVYKRCQRSCGLCEEIEQQEIEMRTLSLRPGEEICLDELATDLCEFYTDFGTNSLCSELNIQMGCAKTCQICQVTEKTKPVDPNCQDMTHLCDPALCQWKELAKFCHKTCNLCKPVYEGSRSEFKDLSKISQAAVGPKVFKPDEVPETDIELIETKVYLYQPNCSQRPGYEGYKKIVGGVNSEKGEHPWIVNVFIDRVQACGASLITNFWSVTAAHCLIGERKSNLILVAGDHMMVKFDKISEQRRLVSQMIKHPYYFKKSDDHDIALLKAGPDPFIFNNFVQPICLPYDKMEVEEGFHCQIAGWGDTLGKTAKVLKTASVKTFANDWCYDRYISDFDYTPNMICAGRKKGGVDSCTGDSGGPMICSIDQTSAIVNLKGIGNMQLELIGITSWGEGCAERGLPGVYVKVSNYITWVSAVTGIPTGYARDTPFS